MSTQALQLASQQLNNRLTIALAAKAKLDEEINGLRNVLQGFDLASNAAAEDSPETPSKE